MSDFGILLSRVVEESAVPRAELAEACGELYSTFNRQVNPNDPVNFPAELLIPLVKSARDPRILEFLVSECYEELGLVLVKDSCRAVNKPEGLAGHIEAVTEYLNA